MTSDDKKPANRTRSWRCLARRLCHSLVPGVTSLILVLVVGAPGRLLAQDNQAPADLMDLSMEELMKVEVDSVYGASGYKQKVTEAPASVTIITAGDIQRYGYRTLADVLRHVPGFYVNYDRNYSYVGVRGFNRPGDYNSRLLLLVDGHRVNDNLYDEAAVGTDFPVDIDLIDRVEVIRGPNSSLYVASAFLGVINVVTKRVRDAKGLTASGAVASYGTYTSRVTYGHQFESGLAMLLSGTYYDSHGQDRLYFKEFDTAGTNHGIAENRDGDQFHQVFSKLSYRDFTLEGVYGSREKNVPTASFGTIFNDPAERTVDARGYLDLKYNHRFGSDWGYFGRLSYDHTTYNGFYPGGYSQSGGPARVLNLDIAKGQSWGAEFALSKKLFENQTLVLGSDYRDNFQQDQSNHDVQPFKQNMNDHRTSSIWGIFAQDEIRLRSNLVLDLGLRHDQYSTFGGTTNPRGALIYSPLEKTTVKFLYGQSFRAPNAYELYYKALGLEANTHLKPETAKTTELVVEQYIGSHVQLAVSGYNYPVRGLISQQTDPATGALVFENSQSLDMHGVEIALKRQSSSGLEVGGSLSFQNTESEGGGRPVTNSPHQLGQFNLSVPLFKRKLFASTALDYVGRRRTLAGSYAGAYVVPDFSLFSKNALKSWEISASLYNAFSQRYADPASVGNVQETILQDGRNFRLKFTYHF
jgi:outer membrane receptor for ferrienterochelin and colicins